VIASDMMKDWPLFAVVREGVVYAVCLRAAVADQFANDFGGSVQLAQEVCTDDTIALIRKGSEDLCDWVYAPPEGMPVAKCPRGQQVERAETPAQQGSPEVGGHPSLSPCVLNSG
jgi:hypothetical protein